MLTGATVDENVLTELRHGQPPFSNQPRQTYLSIVFDGYVELECDGNSTC